MSFEPKTYTYTHAEALEHSLEYFKGNELAASVFINKYALKNNNGDIIEPTPIEMHNRLASEFARIDIEKYNASDKDERFLLYREVLDQFARIVPQGSPMAAIGNKYQRMSASNCVVVDSPEDSISGIITSGLELAQLYKRRCGVGIDISTLRPDGASVNNAARTTSGAWSFADFYSYITRMIGQEGRRGALMVTMDVHHPDVIKFATMKHDLTKVTGANISIRLSDAFLEAVENDTEYEQRWPCEGPAKIRHTVPARMVWNTIIESATKTAEPGLILWGNMLRNLPAHCYPEFKTLSTNPCSEIALSAYDSCRLISLNLTGYVIDPFSSNAQFDFNLFTNDIITATRMADNLIDLELELINRIKDVCQEGHETELWERLYKAGHDGRRTGLGTHGLADTLAQLGIRYDSKNAIQIVENIYKTLRNSAYQASVDLAEIRGAFPAFDWEKEKDCEFIQRLPESIREKMAIVGRRNISLLTQAPTGSVSIVSKVGKFERFNVSSGVEPVFRNSYTRRKKINSNDIGARVDFVDVVGDKWQEYKVFHSNVQNYIDMHDMKNDLDLPEFFVTSDQIDWKKRIEIQSAEQKFIDHSISSTINLPKGTSSDVVGSLYLDAWKKGLKGVTVYVDGSRDGVLVTKEKNEKPNRHAPKRPITLKSETHKIKIDFGDGNPRNAYVTVSFSNETNKPYEIFVVAPYQGLDEKDLQILELTARTTSMNLRHGMPLRYICEQLDKIGGQYIFSIPTNIAKVLRKYDESTEIVENIEKKENINTESEFSKCPSCHKRTYMLSGGCGNCVDPECAYSGCS